MTYALFSLTDRCQPLGWSLLARWTSFRKLVFFLSFTPLTPSSTCLPPPSPTSPTPPLPPLLSCYLFLFLFSYTKVSFRCHRSKIFSDTLYPDALAIPLLRKSILTSDLGGGPFFFTRGKSAFLGVATIERFFDTIAARGS